MSENINDCVLLNHTECQYSGHLKHEQKLFQMDSQIAFFCGDSEICRTMGSDIALKIAKENIKKHYITIGMLIIS